MLYIQHLHNLLLTFISPASSRMGGNGLSQPPLSGQLLTFLSGSCICAAVPVQVNSNICFHFCALYFFPSLGSESVLGVLTGSLAATDTSGEGCNCTVSASLSALDFYHQEQLQC